MYVHATTCLQVTEYALVSCRFYVLTVCGFPSLRSIKRWGFLEVFFFLRRSARLIHFLSLWMNHSLFKGRPNWPGGRVERSSPAASSNDSSVFSRNSAYNTLWMWYNYDSLPLSCVCHNNPAAIRYPTLTTIVQTLKIFLSNPLNQVSLQESRMQASEDLKMTQQELMGGHFGCVWRRGIASRACVCYSCSLVVICTVLILNGAIILFLCLFFIRKRISFVTMLKTFSDCTTNMIQEHESRNNTIMLKRTNCANFKHSPHTSACVEITKKITHVRQDVTLDYSVCI